MTDADIRREAEKIAAVTLSDDKPTLREILASDIVDLCIRVRDEAKREQREMDMEICKSKGVPENTTHDVVRNLTLQSIYDAIRKQGATP